MRFSLTDTSVDYEYLEDKRIVLESYLDKLRRITSAHTWNEPESFINLPSESALHQSLDNFRGEINADALKCVVLVGIGGSSLGARAVYDAMTSESAIPKLIIADTCEPRKISAVAADVRKYTNPSEIIFLVVSKSGTTSETIFNAQYLFDEFGEKIGPDRWVVVSDADSALSALAKGKGMRIFEIPENVGGRYSVFSAAGLLPIALCYKNWRELIAGASEANSVVLSDDIERNPALASASALYYAAQTGVTVHDLFVFEPSLKSLGEWYRQLFGESLGKTNSALLPTVSVGTNDLHSVAQFYLGGPKMAITTFLSSENKNEHALGYGPFAGVVEGMGGKRSHEFFGAILSGVKGAYTDRGRQFMTCEIGAVSLHEIGYFMTVMMVQVILLAHLYGVNAFDQPAVELYKSKTRELLSKL